MSKHTEGPYKAGDKVLVRLTSSRLENWNKRAWKSIKGAAGVVEKVKEGDQMTPTVIGTGRILVAFDKPCSPSFAYGSEITGFWLMADEIELIAKAEGRVTCTGTGYFS